MVKTYKSAVDLWLAAILVGVPLGCVFTGLSVSLGLNYLNWHEQLGWYAGLVFIAGGVTLALVTAALTLPCRYVLKETELHIQCGIFQSTVPYRNIRRLELSCSLWAAPALSLNRVKIVLDNGFHLVSPGNRKEFVEDLQARIDQ